MHQNAAIIVFWLYATIEVAASTCLANMTQIDVDHMECIKSYINREAALYEKEIDEHRRKKASICFASTIEQSEKEKRCFLPVAERDSDAVDKDRRKNRRDYKRFIRDALKAIRGAPDAMRTCLHDHMSAAIVDETNRCIHSKNPNADPMPSFPDIRNASAAYNEAMQFEEIFDYIHIQSHVDLCRINNAAFAEATEACVRNPFKGFMSIQCKAIQHCDKKVIPQECLEQFNRTREQKCSCIRETRRDLKLRISSLPNAIQKVTIDSAKSKQSGLRRMDECVSTINSHLDSNGSNWVGSVNNALDTCVMGSPKNHVFGLNSLFMKLCRKLMPRRMLKLDGQYGIVFIANFIDAFNERATRFCEPLECFETRKL
ncbi:hypothetical protein Tcan_16411 [Toxocara canis]|uniref:DUF19 domain-containing protein n=1 Tax=Toxocara canis TaxID=6265 RepID=A0A0B2V3B1_TOXCA|nr:hypothetical protein Tcan_16411 [Toxocara canis]